MAQLALIMFIKGGDKMNSKPTTAQIIQAVIDVILAIGTALIAIFK